MPTEHDERFQIQLDVVIAAYRERGHTIGYDWSPGRSPDATPDLLFEQDALLVAKRDLHTLPGNIDHEIAGGRGVASLRSDRDEENDLVVVKIDPATRALDEIRRLEEDSSPVRPGMLSPNHLVSICGVCLCPATEPAPVPPGALPVPHQAPGNAGSGVSVQVIDTGVWQGFEVGHPWFAAAAGDPVTRVDEDLLFPPVTGQQKADPFVDGVIREYAGHGVFVAGVLRCVAPATEIFVRNNLTVAGAVLEDVFGDAMLAGLTTALHEQPDIISLSAGGTTFRADQLRGLEQFLAELDRPDCTTLLVAAAGNDGQQHMFFPAASAPDHPDSVIAVGALRGDGLGRACFSNYGDWVSVYAPGERMVNAFFNGKYRYIDPPKFLPDGVTPTCRNYSPPLAPGCTCLDAPPRHSTVDFTGMAQWSGTSFSTPFVAGRIAAHMTETGEKNARVAAQSLLATLPSIEDAGDGVVLNRVMT